MPHSKLTCSPEKALEKLREVFGHDKYRGATQELAVMSLLQGIYFSVQRKEDITLISFMIDYLLMRAGRDVFVCMPTGKSGLMTKSSSFQVVESRFVFSSLQSS